MGGLFPPKCVNMAGPNSSKLAACHVKREREREEGEREKNPLLLFPSHFLCRVSHLVSFCLIPQPGNAYFALSLFTKPLLRFLWPQPRKRRSAKYEDPFVSGFPHASDYIPRSVCSAYEHASYVAHLSFSV